jgi:hypothetical protein
MDLVEDKEPVWRILDMLTEYHVPMGKKLIEMGVDAI